MRKYSWNCFINIRNSSERFRKHSGPPEGFQRISGNTVYYRLIYIYRWKMFPVMLNYIYNALKNIQNNYIFSLISMGLIRPRGWKETWAMMAQVEVPPPFPIQGVESYLGWELDSPTPLGWRTKGGFPPLVAALSSPPNLYILEDFSLLNHKFWSLLQFFQFMFQLILID